MLRRVTGIVLVSLVIFSCGVYAAEARVTFDSSLTCYTSPASVKFDLGSALPISPPLPVVREATTNLALVPAMADDSDADGVADSFVLSSAPSLDVVAYVSGGQVIFIRASQGPGEAVLVQQMTGQLGSAVTVSVDGAFDDLAGLSGLLGVRWLSGAGYLNGGASDPAPATFGFSGTWRLAALSVPQGATGLEVRVGLTASAAGAFGSVTLRNLQVEAKSYPTLFTEGVLPYGPVLSKASGVFCKTAVKAPSIFYDEGRYRMWYEGVNVTASAIGYAESLDLYTWWQGNGFTPVSLPGFANAAGPSVFKDGPLYRMWFHVPSTTDAAIYYATSGDGLAWTVGNSGQPVLTKNAAAFCGSGVLNPCVIRVQDVYHMWFETYTSTSGSKIGHATSPDGVAWTVQNAGGPVLAPVTSTFYAYNVFAPSVVHDGLDYHLLFGAQQTSTATYTLGGAVSADGNAWTILNGGAAVLALSGKDDPAVWLSQGTARCLPAPGSYYHSSRDWVNWTAVGATSFAKPNLVDGIGSPLVLYDGQQYSMYFTRRFIYPYLEDMYEGWDVLVSKSRDGLAWSNPQDYFTRSDAAYGFSSKYRGAEGLSILTEGGVDKRWYSMCDGIHYLFNRNGTDHVDGCVETGTTHPNINGRFPTVLPTATGYEIWYISGNAEFGALRHGDSADGITWTTTSASFAGGQKGTTFPNTSTIGYPRVTYDGSLYTLWFTAGDRKAYCAESSNGHTWTVRNYGVSPLAPRAGSFYSYQVGAPTAITDSAKQRLWFLGRTSSSHPDGYIGYAEWPRAQHGAVGTREALDTGSWSKLTSISVEADAGDSDIRFLFSTDDYGSLMDYSDGQWRSRLGGGWEAISADAAALFDVGMTLSQVRALGAKDLAGLLASGDSLRVVAVFSDDPGLTPALTSMTFRYVGDLTPMTYALARASYDPTNWNALKKIYVTLIQPEYAESRFFASVDGGATLKAYRNGAWGDSEGGSDVEIQAQAAGLFSSGMTRDELELLTTSEFADLLPAGSLDLYALQKVRGVDVTGYKAQFYVNWVEKYVFASRGQLRVMMEGGVVYTFELTAAEIQSFVEWVSQAEKGRAPAFYTLPLPTGGTPYSRLMARIYYSKIISFEIGEYLS